MSRARRAGPALVLDNEAVQLLLPARQYDRRRRALFASIEAATVVRTPTAARVEAAAARSPRNALLARLTSDAPLDAVAAERAIELGTAAGGSSRPSPVDLAVAVEAERLAATDRFLKVEVLTSDRDDLERLASACGAVFAVVGL